MVYSIALTSLQLPLAVNMVNCTDIFAVLAGTYTLLNTTR